MNAPIMIRRALAGIMISLFMVFALPAFLLFGLSNSVGKPSFYEGPVVDQAYALLIKITADNLAGNDEVIAKHFNGTELKTAMMEVFPVSMFRGMVKEFSGQVEMLKENPERPLAVSLKTFREGLLTFANNLSYKLFQSLPVCKGGEIPAEDVQGLPTCIPEGVEYNLVAAPFSKQFESSVYAAVPEHVQIDLNAAMDKTGLTMADVVNFFLMAKYVLYAVMLGLLAVIALLIYSPFSLIAKYEGVAFVMSGLAGYGMGLGLQGLPEFLIDKASVTEYREDILQMVQYTMSFIAAESQKMALVFLALGAILVLVRVFMASRYRDEKSV